MKSDTTSKNPNPKTVETKKVHPNNIKDKENSTQILGIIGLVISIMAGLFSLCAGLFALPIVIIGILLSGIAYYDQQKNKIYSPIPLIGLVIGILTIILNLIILIFSILLYGSVFFFSAT